MCGLTPAIKLTYAYPIAVKPAVGFRSLNTIQGAQAPISSVLFLFVAPEVLLFGSVRGETFGSAGFALCCRSANPAHAATNLFRSELWQWWFNQHKVTIMSTPLFVPRGDITPAECRDYVRIYAFQAQALTRLIDDALIESVAGEISKDTQDQLGWALWALSDVLRAQIALCERLEGVGFTTVDRAR